MIQLNLELKEANNSQLVYHTPYGAAAVFVWHIGKLANSLPTQLVESHMNRFLNSMQRQHSNNCPAPLNLSQMREGGAGCPHLEAHAHEHHG